MRSEDSKELEFLERSIGPTGKLALAPFLRDGPTASWQKEILAAAGR